MKRAIDTAANNRNLFFSSLIFSLLRTVSMYFYQFETLIQLPYIQLVVVQIARFIINTLLFFVLTILVQKAMVAISRTEHGSESNQLDEITGGWKIFVLFALAWLPFLLIKYPGAMCWDSWHILHTYRMGEITTHHSVLYSLVFGHLVDYFSSLGHANWGLFAFVCIHYALTVFASGELALCCRRLGLHGILAILMVSCIIINPYIIEYIGVAIKDSAYASFIVIFVAQIINIIIDQNEYDEDGLFAGMRPFRILLLAISGLLLVLTRKNGLYVIFATFLCLLFHCRELRRRGFSIVLGALLFVSISCNTYLNQNIAVQEGSIKEALSLPFQQTARYVRDYKAEISPEEREAIDAVLQYDTLADRYDPRICDPVKNKFQGNLEDLKGYFVVWFKQFFRHPLCYLSATMEQNYYLFVPEAELFDIVIYRDDDYGIEIGSEVIVSERTPYYEKIFHNPDFLNPAKSWVVDLFYSFHFNPFVAISSNVSIAAYTLLILIAIAINNNIDVSLPFVPLVISLLFVILGPAIHGHPRYMFPIMFCLPMLICFICYELHRREYNGGLSEGSPAHLALNDVCFNMK